MLAAARQAHACAPAAQGITIRAAKKARVVVWAK
jgi:hypothetical protein